jgi:hypothetical protein
MGSIYEFSGYVTNTGDAVLTNVFVFGPQGASAPVLGPIELAPNESEYYYGSYTVPSNTCSVTVTASGNDICAGTVAQTAASCPVDAVPAIVVTETCPPGSVSSGSPVDFGGSVSNSGNMILTNVLVFSGAQAVTPILGPLTLAPGASAPFAGTYTALGGSNPITNSIITTNKGQVITTNTTTTIVTNNGGSVTTNDIAPTFGTVDPVSGALTDRFSVPNNMAGLMYVDQNENWGPTLFYSIRTPSSGPDEFDTISTIAPNVGVVTDRVALGEINYDALSFAAPDVGYGSVNFYYIRAGGPTFGEIIAQGASSSADLWALANSGYNALTFSATDLGNGANVFYYLRLNSTGGSTFGTINPTPGGVETDLYTVGTNFDSLVFVSGAVSTWGAANFAYLRHTSTGSIIGTINPTTKVVTDRLSLSTNLLSALAFAATDVGYGPNLFYYLRSAGSSTTTNTVTTYTTNIVLTLVTNTVLTYTTNSTVVFTPTNTVMAIGMDACSGTVTAAANCLGPVVSAVVVEMTGAPTLSGGVFSLALPTQNGVLYIVQYKDSLSDPTWTDLETVTGTGGILSITDPAAGQQAERFYRVILGQ